MKTPTGLRALLPFLLSSLLCGCLEFDAQDVVLRHDAAEDRIDILLVYRGLYASGSNTHGDKLDKALKDLDGAMQAGRTAFWSNWPFSLDLTAEQPAPVRALLAHVDDENGGLFTDPKGHLCGFLFLRVREAAAFVKQVNTLLEVALQAALVTGFKGRGPPHRVDDETRELMREFLRSGGKLLAVAGDRIEVRLPCSGADLGWVLGRIETHFLNNVVGEIVDAEQRHPVREAAAAGDGGVREQRKGSVQQAPSFRFFRGNAFTIERRKGMTVLGLGVADAEELRIQKAPYRRYDDGLLQKLRARGDKIEDGTPDQEIGRRFAAFCGRDAVLPETLAAQRQK